MGCHMSKAAYHKKPENEQPVQRTIRRCLKCRQPFSSAWSGERVCAKCKASSAWREGTGANLQSWRY